MNTYQQLFVSFFLRNLLGLIFFFQGLGKIFIWGFSGMYENAFKPLENIFPVWWLQATMFGTTFVELSGGALLILGWKRRWALTALGLDLLVVSFGHGVQAPVWDLSHVFPRAILLAGLLLLPENWDHWSVDALLKKRRTENGE